MAKVNTTQKKNVCELHACMRHAMRLCRWVGYFPVAGLDQLSVEGIRFSFKSIYSVYNIATILGQITVCCFVIVWLIQNDITLTSVSVLIFYITALIKATFMIKLAQQWPKLMATAEESEQSTIIKSQGVAKKSSFIAYIYMSLGLVEHLLYIKFIFKLVVECLQENGQTNNIIEDYIKYLMPYIFNYVSYNIYKAIIAEILCIQATFMWSFSDVMIMCFSVYITSYLRSLNKIINSKKTTKGIPWGLLREYYSKIILLVKDIDNQLSTFILVSLFTDLFAICFQLFKFLHRNYSIFHVCDEEERKNMFSAPAFLLYYLYSFSFLLLRALSVCLFAANVHAAAQEPIIALYDVSPADYDMELHRFQSQLRFTEIAFTGKFFTITRNMVMQVIGTIITYELLLLQIIIEPEKITWPIRSMHNTSTIETTVN